MAETFFDRVHKQDAHTPDVLACLANLSNDEVFTPPEVVNQMLDMLPQELFESTETTFLDPACKTGVFLREIAKRLLNAQMPGYQERMNEISEKKALGIKLKSKDEDYIDELQARLDHIFHKQLFGIAITELTSLLSRRSVYCSMYPNGKYSVVPFDNAEGNIRFRSVKHTWENGKCVYCGASQDAWDRGDDLETHAYEFIHTISLQEAFNMAFFDVIISNPPYQLNVGNDGGNSSKAKAIYHKFITQAIKMNPRYVCMITPSRWMTKSTEGIPDDWVDTMLTGNHFMRMVDFDDASLCFPGVEIKGGVNYFLYSKDYQGECNYEFHDKENNVQNRIGNIDALNCGIVVRNTKALSILKKIESVEGELYFNNDQKNFSGLVSPKDFFTNKQKLTSSWSNYKNKKDEKNTIKYYLNKSIHKKEFAFISIDDVPKNQKSIKLNKVYIPAAGGSGNDSMILGKPFFGEKNSVCSQTYLVIGYDPMKHSLTKEQCENIVDYIKTKFFRYLVSIKKKTQNGPRMVYQFVPMQDFSRTWTDEKLYKKYKLTKEEIELIESSIKPMDLDGGDD